MDRKHLSIFTTVVAGICLLFHRPLIEMGRYAASEDLYSHVFLVPLVSVYLVWIQKERLQTMTPRRDSVWAMLALGIGVLGILGHFILKQQLGELERDDRLSLLMFSFVCFVFSAFLFIFGTSFFSALLFPLLFLLLIVPFPSAVMAWITRFFQYASADLSGVLFQWSGTPVFRDGLVFQLPDLTIEVADECSGIRSSFVLFITGLLSGYLMLRSMTGRIVMALLFIPIGIFRNAARILTISLLTVHVDPDIIHGPLHHRGGPVFFALSMIPLCVILILLFRVEKRTMGNDGLTKKTDQQ